MIAPKVGDRVRVVLEGEVSSTSGPTFSVEQCNYIRPSDGHVVSVEVLPPPEPEYRDGDVVRCDTHGGALVRTAVGWLSTSTGEPPPFDFEGCDTTLLVRHGDLA